MKRAAAFLAPALACLIAVQAMLAMRTWMQLTASDLDEGAARTLFAFTHDLAAPFAVLSGEPPRDETGVVDFTVLVAIVGYFFLALVLIALTCVLTGVAGLGHWGAGRAARLFQAREESEVTVLWQPRHCTKLPGARLYVSSVRRVSDRADASAALMGRHHGS
jgi:hypothetical protein